ncbi:hypothetical protein D9M68_289210 [compost metagenome]
MGFGELQHTIGDRQAVAGTGRVLQPGIGEEGLGPVLAQQLGEDLHIRTLGRPGHADDADLVVAQVGQEVDVAGVVHQHAVTRLQQRTDHQVQPLAGALGEDDLLAIHLGAAFGEVALHPLEQGLVAAGFAVLGDSASGPPEAAQRQVQAVFVQPVAWQAAAARLQGGIGVEGRVQQPVDVLQRRRLALLHLGRGSLRHEETIALARLHIAQRHQPVIGLDHGEGADIELFRGRPDRWQACALGQAGVLDPLREVAHQVADP